MMEACVEYDFPEGAAPEMVLRRCRKSAAIRSMT